MELLQGRGFLSVLGPLGYTFEFNMNNGSTFFMRLALRHIEIATNGSLSEMHHPLLVDNVWASI